MPLRQASLANKKKASITNEQKEILKKIDTKLERVQKLFNALKVSIITPKLLFKKNKEVDIVSIKPVKANIGSVNVGLIKSSDIQTSTIKKQNVKPIIKAISVEQNGTTKPVGQQPEDSIRKTNKEIKPACDPLKIDVVEIGTVSKYNYISESKLIILLKEFKLKCQLLKKDDGTNSLPGLQKIIVRYEDCGFSDFYLKDIEKHGKTDVGYIMELNNAKERNRKPTKVYCSG